MGDPRPTSRLPHGVNGPSKGTRSADLAIVIVNWNARDMLENCLRSIEENRGPLKVDVIVVDNASRDGSGEMVQERFPEVVYIQSGGNIGFARANNLARSRVTAPIVLFLNPDTLLKRGTLEAMVRIFAQDEKAAVVGCKIRDEHGVVQELPSQWWMSPLRKGVELLLLSEHTEQRMKKIIPYHDPEASGYVSYLYGACLMVKKETLDLVGWFDDRFFMYCEDVDLCHRINSLGLKIYYLAEAEIIHLIGGATKNASGSFAGVMMLDSINKLMGKYYGARGVVSFKSMVWVNSQIRLFLLALLNVLTRAGRCKRDINFEFSRGKYRNAMKWCMARHPGVVPGDSLQGGEAERSRGKVPVPDPSKRA